MKAQLRAVLFRGVNLRMKFEPKDGLEVLARGRLTVYEPRGDYQLQIEELQPRGIGPSGSSRNSDQSMKFSSSELFSARTPVMR